MGTSNRSEICILDKFPIRHVFEQEMLHTVCKLEPSPCFATSQFMMSSCYILNDVFLTHHVVHFRKKVRVIPVIDHPLLNASDDVESFSSFIKSYYITFHETQIVKSFERCCIELGMCLIFIWYAVWLIF